MEAVVLNDKQVEGREEKSLPLSVKICKGEALSQSLGGGEAPMHGQSKVPVA